MAAGRHRLGAGTLRTGGVTRPQANDEEGDHGLSRAARLQDRRRRRNTARAIDAIRSHPEVSIAVFPELYLSGYTYRDLDELALAPTSDELASIAAAADAETAVVIGFAERTPEGTANSAACIDTDGSSPVSTARRTCSRRRPTPASFRARS